MTRDEFHRRIADAAREAMTHGKWTGEGFTIPEAEAIILAQRLGFRIIDKRQVSPTLDAITRGPSDHGGSSGDVQR